MEDLVYVQTHAIEESHWWFLGMREIYRKQLEAIPRSEPWEILDVGCGTGGNLSLLTSFGRAVGMDYSPAAAAFTRGRGWDRVTVGSATDLPFPDEHFHVVTAFGVIEHLEDDARMLREMLRVTRPGGHLLFMTSAHPWLWSAHDDAVHHQRRYRRRELGGRVQGVGFRWWTRARALELGLVGSATNLADGRVEVVAEGPEASLRALVALLRGPGTPGEVVFVGERYEPPRAGMTGFTERAAP